MRRTILVAAMGVLLCIVTWCVCAEGSAPLPASVVVLCEVTYPNHEVSVFHGWGNDRLGQFVLVLSNGTKHILCIAEKAETDADYRFAVANDKALREGEDLPSILIDTGGDSLFYRYTDIQYSYSYHAVKSEAGIWGPVDLIRYDTYNNQELTFTMTNDLLFVNGYDTDAEGNILRRYQYTPVPATWIQDTLMLDRFDIAKFPTNEYDVMSFGGLQAAAEVLLPEGAIVIDGGTRPCALLLLADIPDGTRRLFLSQWTESDGWHVVESSPLPEGAWIDVFHSWDGTYVEWMENDREIGYSLSPLENGKWVVTYVMAADWFAINQNYVKEATTDRICYGTFPFADVQSIDWNMLPRTSAEAVAMLDTTGWARVTSDDPNNRLHLLAAPGKDANSLGKYYSGTPVQILEDGKDWCKVSVAGVTGYMMRQFLTFGHEMMDVRCCYLQKIMKEEALDQGIAVYVAPNKTAEVVGQMDAHNGVWPLFSIIGIVGDDWYHITWENGMSGYVEAKHFCDRNG